MKDFFKMIKESEYHSVSLDKMHTLFLLLSKREEALEVSFSSLVNQLDQSLLSWEDAYEDWQEEQGECKNDLFEDYVSSGVRLFTLLSCFIKFFYPLMEQVDSIVDDGIKNAKDLKGFGGI